MHAPTRLGRRADATITRCAACGEWREVNDLPCSLCERLRHAVSSLLAKAHAL